MTGTSVITNEPHASTLGSKISSKLAANAVVSPNIRRAVTHTSTHSPTAKTETTKGARANAADQF